MELSLLFVDWILSMGRVISDELGFWPKLLRLSLVSISGGGWVCEVTMAVYSAPVFTTFNSIWYRTQSPLLIVTSWDPIAGIVTLLKIGILART